MPQRNATPVTRSIRERVTFPRHHAVFAGTLSIALSVLAFSVTGEDSVAKRHSQPLELSIKPAQERIDEALPGTIESAATIVTEPLVISSLVKSGPTLERQAAEKAKVASTKAADAAPVKIEVQEPEWQTITVRRGDSLSRIFQRVGLGTQTLSLLLKQCEQASDLKRLHPGEKLGFQLKDGKLLALRYNKSPLDSIYIERNEGTESYSSREVKNTPEVRLNYREATINNSLFLAGAKAQLPESIIMGLANVFGGVIDFVYDTRSGDSFSVLYEELYLDGEKIDGGKILAAHFNNRGSDYPAFYYENANGEGGYYNEDGVSMRKAFLRSPVDFTRISSNFNPSRLHPIFKTRRPHKGIDYAAARGTPVRATGIGRVIEAGYSRANGNFVVIKHGESFVTKYLHLHKKQVARGQRVRQGQIIGQVGSTGYATGPHLHYEFLLNGVHRNPRTVLAKLPKADSIDKVDLAAFKAALLPLQQQFAAYRKPGPSNPMVVASYQSQKN
jgi:murein DD-endopeptidase MepM/ murein hydrolase activator NlpD